MYIDILVSLRPNITMYIVVGFVTTFFGDFAENRPPASRMTMYPYKAGRAKIGLFEAYRGMWKTCLFSVDNSSLNLWITTAGRVRDPFPLAASGAVCPIMGRASGAVGLGLFRFALVPAEPDQAGRSLINAGRRSMAGADTPFHLLGR